MPFSQSAVTFQPAIPYSCQVSRIGLATGSINQKETILNVKCV